MGVMKAIHLDIKEIGDKIIKEIDENSLKMFPDSSDAAISYKYLVLERVGVKLIRASAKYKEMVEPEEE